MTWAYDISLGCRLLVGTVFAVSVVAEARSRAAWRSYSSWLAGLPLRPLRARAAPTVLTSAEAVVVVLVAWPTAWPIGLAAGSVLCLALTVGLALAVRRGSRQPCHCFGSSSEPLSGLHVTRNMVLLMLAIAGSACAAAGARVPGPAEASLAVIGGLAAAMLIVFFGDIAALLKPMASHPVAP